MNNNGIKKEALAARDNPFAGSKGWSGLFSAFGKGSLEKKSDSYKQAVRIMTEIDDNIRAAFKRQQQFAKEAYWGKFKMDLSRFAHAVNNFFNQQVIMTTLAESSPTKYNLTALMSKVPFEVYKRSKFFGKLDDAPDEPQIYTDPDFDANEFTETLNKFNDEGGLKWVNYANEIIAKREDERGKRKDKNKPEGSSSVKNLADKATEEETQQATMQDYLGGDKPPSEEERTQFADQEPTTEEPKKVVPGAEIAAAAAEIELYQDMVKVGLLDSMHYKSLMRGRSLKRSMEKIFDLMQSTLDQSAGTLNAVSHAVNVGDPDEYIKEISKMVRAGNNAMVRIVPLWNEHFKDLVAQTDEKEESAEGGADSSAESEPSDVAENIEENIEENVEEPSEENVAETPAPQKQPAQFNIGIPLKHGPIPDLDVQPAYYKDEETYERFPDQNPALTPKAFSKYIETGDYKGLSEYIMKYANSIEDEDLKLKLIAIAEEADE